ncbi:MAG: ATP-binding protein [Chlorobi bacterium]|nr:ATP-binding protein [Chlorobiota bacterium]
MYIKRFVQDQILTRLKHFPAVGIVGPRQVGKTTLAKQLIPEIHRSAVYLDLESLSDYNKLENPEFYLRQHEDKCVIIDEVQVKPDLFPVLRGLIDQNRRPGRFIILGSASPALLRQSSESLAGRISFVQLFPFSLPEIQQKVSMTDHWFYGGFPPALLSPREVSIQWLDDFIKSYTERDFPVLGFPANPIQTRRFWIMLAHLNSQILNYSNLSSSLQLSSPTVKSYIDFFENSFVIKRLYPFYFNIKKRIVKSPKIYLSDTGILHRLLNINDFEALQSHPEIGNSWESYVINQITSRLTGNTELFFYRTKNGSELDLVFVKGMRIHATAEIKYSSSPKLTTGNTYAINTIGTKNNFIITPYSEDYLLRENVRTCSLFDFLEKYLPGL